MKAWLLLLAILLLVASAPVLSASDIVETARQRAEEADDKAISLKGRQVALRKLEEAAQLFLSAGEKEEAARTFNRVGRLQLLLGAPNDALISHKEGLRLLKPAATAVIEIDSLNGLAAAYMLLQDRKAAKKAVGQSLELSERFAYTSGQAQALLTLSDCQNYDNHVLALDTAKLALTLWQGLNDKNGVARANSQIGKCYMAQNILPESAHHYETALGIWRELNEPRQQAAALIMLGFIEQRKGEWGNSISLLTQAQGLLDEEAEPDRMGEIATGMAWAFHENGLPEYSFVHYHRALDYFRRAQDIHMIWYTTWAMGRAYYLSNDHPTAVTYFGQALDMVAPDSIKAAPCYQYLAMIHISKGQYDIALKKLQSALDVYTRTVNPMEAAQVLGLLGQVSERQGRSNQARQYYKQALATFTKSSDRLNQAAIYFALGQLEFKNRNYDLAEDYLKKSTEVTDDIRRASASSDLTAAFSATVHERYEKYIECLMHQSAAHPERNLVVRAFETSEVSRARSLAELLRDTQTNVAIGLDAKLVEKENALRQALRVKEDSKVALLSRAYKSEELAALDAQLAKLKAEHEEVIDTISAISPAYKKITQPVALDLVQIQNQVIADDRTLLLEYSLGSDHSYVWAVTRDSIRSYDLPARTDINEAAKTIHRLLATQPKPNVGYELDAALQKLSQMVLSPVAAELNKQRVIVVADGALHYIPFQVLPSPSGNNEPLVANYEVINVPSASILGELRKEATQRHPKKLVAAFGDPVFASNYAQHKETTGGDQVAALQALELAPFQHALRDLELNGDSFDPSVIQPLFYARRELADLRNAATGDGSLVASGFAATRELLLSTDLTQFAILHFATHGLLDPKRPENSGLVLSTQNSDGQAVNGFVGLQDIYGLRAPVDLVVLSACQTALGKDVRGEGLLGLTRGFMYAGASSVVSSLWKVDDEATGELMRQFYYNMLQNGLTPAAALRTAQNTIRQRPEWQSPYYWAGFTLQGEYRQVIRFTTAVGTSSNLQWMIAIGAVFALLIGFAFWYRRRKQQTANNKGKATRQ